MGRTDHQDLEAAARRVRDVIERLVREGTAVARADGTRHDLFPSQRAPPRGRRCEGGW